jgi:hypothetical protein
MHHMAEPLDNVRDISRIAYGFMASEERLLAHGFAELEPAEVIPGSTRTITAVNRPG